MITYYRLYYFLFLSALVLYIIGLFLPYTTIQCVGVSDQLYTGAENMLALSGLALIVPLIALAFIKHTLLTNWLSIGLSFLLIMLPFLFLSWFPTSLLADCTEKEEIGQKVLSVSSTLFLLAAIVKRRIPVGNSATNKNDKFTDLIDNL